MAERAAVVKALAFEGPTSVAMRIDMVHACRDGAGLAIGRTQRAGDLDIDNSAARKLIELRWQKHPDCASGGAASFDQCHAKLLEQKLVTPASIAGDGKLATVFSNYGMLEERLMK